MNTSKGQTLVIVVLAVTLVLIAAALIFVLFFAAPPQGAAPSVETVEYLADAPRAGSGFRFQDVPPWLFVHVAVIAACQVVSVLFAARLSRGDSLSVQQVKTVQFLCEIPMYLGLFGTLLGVCLTQFITGSLVAPLAYLTTMSGIVLHVFGKLAVWLPIAGGPESE